MLENQSKMLNKDDFEFKWEDEDQRGLAPAHALEHDLSPYFSTLRKFHSTSQMETSQQYANIKREVDRIMSTIVGENLVFNQTKSDGPIRATAWNIERGLQIDGVINALKYHPRINNSDILFLTELDFGMVRSGNRFVAREIAQSLRLNYAFTNCYISLVKGSGLESIVVGENQYGLHGNALFSKFPLTNVHALALPNGKDKMRGKEKRIGCQQAIVGLVGHPTQPFWAVTLHLDAHSTQNLRYRQMKLILNHMDNLSPKLPVIIGGDWNTSTFNSKRAIYSIIGYVFRVLMGIDNVLRNHYPHPDRWFERRLFRELEKRGYDYRSLNQLGTCTLHYDINDLSINSNMGDWIPNWCFWFIRKALKKVNGKCSMKLDWFAGRDLVPDLTKPPKVVGEIHDRSCSLSDHDPIVLDFHLR